MQLNLDKVELQEKIVINWSRGNAEYGYIFSEKIGRREINVCALGTSIGTGEEGIYSEVIEVKSIDELGILGNEEIEGKIVFSMYLCNKNLKIPFKLTEMRHVHEL